MENEVKKSKKRPTKIDEMTKEQIRQAILKKRECNSKALSIVESLIEKSVTEEYLLNCLPEINQSHFDDVVEERSIAKLCGYPLCPKTLTEHDIPKQKYRISLKSNKVYDITARKSFCSNICYKAATYVKNQMLTSPLWFREYEELRQFNLLSLNLNGSMGEEINLAQDNVKLISDKENIFTTINEFANASLKEMTNNHPGQEKIENKIEKEHGIENHVVNNKVSSEQQSGTSITNSNKVMPDKINSDKTENKTSEPTYQMDKQKDISVVRKDTAKKFKSNPLNIVGDIVEKPECKVDPILANTPIDNKLTVENQTQTEIVQKLPQKKQSSIAVITIEVEKCLAEWFTLDTMLLLFGEERVREMVADKGECINEYLNNCSKTIFYNSNTYDQYQALCRKLNMLELEDRNYDAQTLQREIKPLPNYTMLKEESKKLQLKVRAFFSGETEIPEVNVNEEESQIKEEDGRLIEPLVDKNAQHALRRRIVCQHLNQVLPDLLRSLGLLTLSISGDVRLLVNTFKLKATNIMFKPIQWTLIAIVIIKLLSLRDKRLEYLLEQPTAFEHMQLLLLSYKQDGGYLDRLLLWLTDIDRLLDTNDIQLTVQ